MLIEAFSARVRRCKALWTKAKTPGTMGDIWKADEAVYYIEGDVVLKARVKRRLETDDEDDYVLQNQQIKLCEMHDTREAATAAKDAGAPPDGNQKKQADESATGGRDSESDTGKTEQIGAVPTESLESQANMYTREVAQWLTSLASKASERGVLLPTILIEMCPSP